MTLTSTVSGKTPTGTVQLKDGTTDLGAPIALTGAAGAASATATFKPSALTAGRTPSRRSTPETTTTRRARLTTTSFTITFATTLPVRHGVDNARVALVDLAVDPTGR